MELTPEDVSADLDLVDNAPRVDVERVNPDSGAVESTAAGVLVVRRQVEEENREVPGGGSVNGHHCRWHLKAADMAFVPRDRDRIVDNAPPNSDTPETWIVTKVTQAAFGTRYIVESFLSEG